MLRVGLTGGIASGKSTVAGMLAEKGAVHVDFDAVAHFVEEPGRPVWGAIVKAFGKAILNEDQTINRDKLGSIVFKDRKQLAVLNGLVHPAVYEEWTRRLALIVRQNPRAIVLADVPLLIEGGMQSLFDIVLLVYISPQEQLRRLVARNGYREEDAKRRLASQMPIREKMAYADLVIANEDGLEETRTRIDDLWEELLRRERRKHEVNGES